MASIGSIVGGGFKLIAERPAAVAVWCAINLVLGAGSQALMMSMFDPTTPDQTAAMMSLWGLLTPIYLISAVLYIVMLCAAYRAVLRPQEGGFAFMKLGGDELRVLLVLILLGVGFVIAFFILALILGLVAAMSVAILGPVGAVVMIALYIAMIVAVIFFWVRLSLVTPMTFLRHRLVFDEAWALTRGHFWTLFLAYLVLAIVSIVLSAIVYWPMLAPIFAAAGQLASDPEAMQNAQMAQFEQQMNQGLPMLLLWGAVMAVVQTVTMAIGAGATATAARELMTDTGTVSAEDVEKTAEIFE